MTSIWPCAKYNYPSAPVIDSDTESVAEEIPHHKPEPSEQVQEELKDAVPVTEDTKDEKNADDEADNVDKKSGEDDDDDDDEEV